MKYKLDIANTYWKCWVFYIPQWTPEEIEKLHLALLLDWLKGETLTIDQAKVLIEYFRNESRKPVYKFSTAKAFSILFTILAGSFFTMLVATDIGKLTYENLISILKTMTGISLLFLITLHYLEKTILQPNFQKRISRYDRLIRVLTNYILHRQQSDAPTIFNPTLKVVR
ncbi:MAG TPA: hypothetical protein VM802_30285 [Chitinophaga sp.]|uniref:hypothetical protein n=1 Tax=Chitinophaga sp. TaxID=1869181 RepID=UPI002D1B5E5F|nr:hypothetical protein [Chitinophaga sp.]HVI49195.1 hypothetical protein [Chitinophaga sp.]